MLTVTSPHLGSSDLSMVRKYARFVLDRLVRRSAENKSRITIKVLTPQEMKDEADLLDLKTYKAWCTYDGVDDNNIKKFTIVLNAKTVSKTAKKPHIRLKQTLIDLGHELVHVKQYLHNEVFDYKNGDIRYKGKVFDSSHVTDEEKYYFSPWEVAAYGMELGLYRVFCSKLKEEEKE